MEAHDLSKLMETQKPLSVKFDGDIFELEFKDNLIITIDHTTEWDCSCWDIETSIEKQEQKKKWEKLKRDRDKKAKMKTEFDSSLTPEQRKLYENL